MNTKKKDYSISSKRLINRLISSGEIEYMGKGNRYNDNSGLNVEAEFDEIIESVINGNITVNKKRIEKWNSRSVIAFIEHARERGQEDKIKILFK